jgi:Luciferase-like monooxygenase
VADGAPDRGVQRQDRQGSFHADLAKPVQKPHPPVLLGGAFPYAARHAIRYGDGWYPTGGGGDLERDLPHFRAMAAEAGRDPQSLPVTIGGAPEDLVQLERLRELGIARVVTPVPPEKADKVLPILDSWAERIRKLQA